MYELPGRDDVTEVVITPEAINQGAAPIVVTDPRRQRKEA
jgi:ATP-dependent protease Clp ATPase subunit